MCAGSHSISRSIAAIGSVIEAEVLLAPAADLALEVVARLAVVGQAALGDFTVCSAAITRFISS